MSLYDEYLKYAAASDATNIASLFADDGIFYDEGPMKMGMDPVSVQGRDQIEAFFKMVFETRGPIVGENVLINDVAMRYDVDFGDLKVKALGVMTEENGKIKEYRVKVL